MACPVIDFHIHLLKYQQPTESLLNLNADLFPMEGEYLAFEEKYARPENLVTMMKEHGVDYGVILAEYSPLTTGIASNETVAEFCAGHGELIPFCSVNPHITPDPVNTVKQLCLHQGFRGIKLYPTYNHFYPHEAGMYPLYAAAQEMGVPILFHTGSSIFRNSRIKYGNPIFYDDVASDFPELKIVLAHGGRGPWYDEAMTMIRLHRNIYIDVSGLPVRKLTLFFPDIDRFAHKFIFGTDWPQVRMRDSIAKFSQIGLCEESRRSILGGNAAALLKL
ncbi:MAG: amidohydrolase family protein [Desulfarculales bacterium]|jgi:predicted TIM-barrel fold metal-dependent hydrolase|nr:amidohydrolase family protein [Desulfarculales bacterium]